MPGLLDLPLELRLKIFSYYSNEQPPYWRVHHDHPTISLVNRQLRHESLHAFYRQYRWPLCIGIAQEGNMAFMDSEMIRHLQAMQQADQLWRIQRFRVMHTLPGVRIFSVSNRDPAIQPFDARHPDKASFYDTLREIFDQAANLKVIELAWTQHKQKDLRRLYSRACLHLLTILPKSCEYRIMRSWSGEETPPIHIFAQRIKEITGKQVDYQDIDNTHIERDARRNGHMIIRPYLMRLG